MRPSLSGLPLQEIQSSNNYFLNLGSRKQKLVTKTANRREKPISYSYSGNSPGLFLCRMKSLEQAGMMYLGLMRGQLTVIVSAIIYAVGRLMSVYLIEQLAIQTVSWDRISLKSPQQSVVEGMQYATDIGHFSNIFFLKFLLWSTSNCYVIQM